MKSDNKFEQIEQYLDGSMSVAERTNFEKVMAKDKALAKEVKFQREMEEILAHQPEDDLRKNLQILDEKYAKPSNGFNKLWLGSILFLLFLGGVFWYVQSTSNDSAAPIIEKTKMEIEENVTPEKLIEAPEKTPIQIPEKEPIKKKENSINKKSSIPKQKSTPPQKSKPQPIAADFAPNEILEKRLSNLRGGALEITDFKDKFNLKNGQIIFKMAGTFSSENKMEDANLMLHVFNNNMADYEDFKPVFSKEVTLKPSDDEDIYNFNLTAQPTIKAGLYYAQVEDDLGEILFLGKFLVNE